MKWNLTNFLWFCLLFISSKGITQQYAFYSMYQQNWQVINPAAPHFTFIETRNDVGNILNVSYREQWIGMKGTPRNYNIYYETMQSGARRELNAKWGFGLYGESAGVILNNSVYFNYAYPLSFGSRFGKRKNKLFIGFNAGYFFQRVNTEGVNFDDPSDNAIYSFVNQGDSSRINNFFEVSPGLFFTNTNSFYVGISSPRLIKTGKAFSTFHVLNTKPQIHLLAGYFNENKTFQPSIWLRYQAGIDYLSLFDSSPVSATLKVKSQLNKALTVGAGLSTGKWLHLEGGWTLGTKKSYENYNASKLVIGFAYDLPIYKTGFSLGQTAEINLSFSL
jgi:type IX secretion system PorP/SprF family membrane protein